MALHCACCNQAITPQPQARSIPAIFYRRVMKVPFGSDFAPHGRGPLVCKSCYTFCLRHFKLNRKPEDNHQRCNTGCRRRGDIILSIATPYAMAVTEGSLGPIIQAAVAVSIGLLPTRRSSRKRKRPKPLFPAATKQEEDEALKGPPPSPLPPRRQRKWRRIPQRQRRQAAAAPPAAVATSPPPRPVTLPVLPSPKLTLTPMDLSLLRWERALLQDDLPDASLELASWMSLPTPDIFISSSTVKCC